MNARSSDSARTLVLALLSVACMTTERTDLVITKVIEAAANGSACTFDTSSNELTYSTLNPTTNFGLVAAVVWPFRRALFGQHPYARTSETEATLRVAVQERLPR